MSEALEISEVKAGTAEAEVDLAQIGEPGRGGDQTQRRRRDVSLESLKRSHGITTSERPKHIFYRNTEISFCDLELQIFLFLPYNYRNRLFLPI